MLANFTRKFIPTKAETKKHENKVTVSGLLAAWLSYKDTTRDLCGFAGKERLRFRNGKIGTTESVGNANLEESDSIDGEMDD